MNWISVDDAVPESKKKVLIFIRNDTLNKIRIGYIEIYKNGKVKWRVSYRNKSPFANEYMEITHWMPLPDWPEIPEEHTMTVDELPKSGSGFL